MSTPPLTARTSARYTVAMKTHELFTDADIARLERSLRVYKAAAAILAGAGLAVCVLLCCLTETANAERMERTVMTVSALVGWAVITLKLFAADETGRTLGHARMLRQAERVRLAGGVTAPGDRMRIRKSIAFRPLRSESDPRPDLKVIDCRAAALAGARDRIAAVWVANGYIAAWEETP